MKSYLFTYNDKLGTREEITQFIDGLEEVITWRYELPNTFFLVSEDDLDTIFNRIVQRFSTRGRFLLTEYSAENSQGLLTKRGWQVLNEKNLPMARDDIRAAS